MHASLGLEQAVRVLAAPGERRGLEAGLLSGARLEQLGLEPSLRRPAEVHAEEHLRPVLRVGPARSRRDRDDGVARVVLAVEQRLFLEACQLVAYGRDLLADLGLERRVELEQLGRLVDLIAQRVVPVELARDA